jgi:c-di-GMP-binding flagellar brake protein YcgR
MNTTADNASAPSTSEAHASAVALLADDQYSKYVLQSKNEIIPVLRGLVDAVSQVTMFFNEGRDMVLTCLATVNDAKVVLDFGPSNEMNRKALDADKLFCVTQLDKVKIQFVLRGLSQVEVDGRPAFSAKLPESVMRLQRREYFRLSLPVTRPLKCSLTFTPKEGKPTKMECLVADVSGGGLGLVGLPADLPIELGLVLTDVKMDLPEVGMISGRLQVCSVIQSTNRLGIATQRAGCEFVNLPGPMMTLLQRYIIKIERERKARESGM